MTQLLPARDAAALVTDLPHAFLAFGSEPSGDVDAAFDDATEQAGYDYGFAGLVPSISGVDADQVHVAGLEPVTVARASLLAVRALQSGELEPGRAYALPVCADSAYKRRRVRLSLTDPAHPVAERVSVPGPVHHVPAGMESGLRDLAAAAATPLEDTDLLESVTATAARHRFRPLTLAFSGSTVAQFALLDPATGHLTATGFRTAGEARRAAVAAAKDGPVAGSETGVVEVIKIVRRADGNPFASIARTRVASRVALRLTVGFLKNPVMVKTIGWLFYGHLSPTTEPSTEQPAETAEPDGTGETGEAGQTGERETVETAEVPDLVAGEA